MLQRRRRRSIPSSPSSPTSARRPQDRFDTGVHLSSPGEPFAAVLQSSESPAVEITVPSPVFDLPSFPGSTSNRGHAELGGARPSRASDEYIPNRRQPSWESPRPSTSAAPAPYTPGSAHIQPTGASNSSPVMNSPGWPPFERQSNGYYNSESRHRVYEEHNMAHRNYSTSSFNTERSLYDEGASGKNPAHKKGRLNLLNAMNLLSRRRTSQPGKDEGQGLTINTSGVTPLDTSSDVSIRGNKVHDFSAPRPRRILSLDVSSGDNSPLVDSRPSMQEHRQSSENSRLPSSPAPRRAESPKHSPLFREHFDEDRSSLQPAQTAYLHSLASARNIRGDRLSSNPPAFAKRLPIRIPGEEDSFQVGDRPLDGRDPPIAKQASTRLPPRNHTIESPSAPPPPPPPKDPPLPELNLPTASALPKHMTSTSSRFSFQLGNYDCSIQEKLLEEKHKQQQASKRLAAIDAEDEPEEDGYNDYDFGADDGLEEKIPGVNADWDEEDLEEPIPGVNADDGEEGNTPIFTLPVAMAGLSQTIPSDGLRQYHFTPHVADFDASQSQTTTETTPRDADGLRIGVADREDILHSTPAIEMFPRDQSGGQFGVEGLGISTQARHLEPDGDASLNANVPLSHTFDDEDLYFDDGDFDEGSAQHDDPYDESWLDGKSGHLRDIPAENDERFRAAQRQSKTLPMSSSLRKLPTQSSSNNEATEPERDGPGELQSVAFTSKSSSFHDMVTSDVPSKSISLTEGNLAAYHEALVSATNEAHASGRFDRTVTFSHLPDDMTSQPQVDESQPGQSMDESRVRHNLGHAEMEEEEEDDGFAFGDDYDDDLMIAEANAEALENDDEGFYGREFGFYARAQGKGNSEHANGGYFTARGSNGIKRSHSGKANFQEPSLTPITEISEWSNRNSVSFQILPMPASAGSMQSPGIAQLLEQDATDFDEAVSMSKLMKFRREAFGGSSKGMNSHGGGHHTSSPHIRVPSHMGSFFMDHSPWLTPSVHGLPGSVDIPESEEEDDEGTGLPTLTQSTPHKKLSDASPSTPQSQTAISPSFGGSWEKSKISHSRTSSGAESVSYVKDPGGSDRWVLERRRTGDSGEIEVVGREYLPGARI